MRWLVMPFLRYADFKGRSGRTEFWTFFGLSVAALILTVVATGVSTDTANMPQPKVPGANASPAGAIGYMLWWLASIVPWFAVQVRRFHDQGRSGWLCLIGAAGYVAVGFGAMPLAAILFLAAMALMVLPGEMTENRYGLPVQVRFSETSLDENASFSSVNSNELDDKVDIKSGTDGLYYVKGRAFASLVEAERATKRLTGKQSPKISSPNATLDTPVQLSEADAEANANAVDSVLDDGIVKRDDGRYYAKGYGYITIEQARRQLRPKTAIPQDSKRVSETALQAETRRYSDTKNSLTSLELHSENAEPYSELPVAAVTPFNLYDDVKSLGSGKYGCGGHIFSSRDEAEQHSQRSALVMAEIAAAPAVPQTRADGASSSFNEIEPGINFGRDGKLYVRGKAYWTIAEARTANAGIQSNIPADVKSEGDGRFSCGGYTFNSLEQAISFSKRKSGRSEEVARSISPFSFVPISKPPQPSPPKEDRSSFFGLGSSAKKQIVAEHWVATPTNLSAGGVPFEGHLVYFGTRPRSQQYERHRSLIDPNLDVSNGRDPHGSTFSYWPNYSELRPEARRSYLEWLSGGRSDPNTPVGYVFIYFYGLERRLVKDRSEADAPAIMDELRRLLAIYGENHSFKNYCSALLDMGELLFGNVEETPTPTLDNRYSWELPIRLRVYLGRKVAAGATLDSNDALCWTLGHPLLYPRTPVTRCFAEFCELWTVRFGEQFPKGLSVREPKARLNFQYRSASSEFNATATVDDLPDVGAISGPISKFELLLGSCSDEHDPLSRFLGRNPAETDSAIADALLPEPLRDNGGQSNFGQFSQFLTNASQHNGFAEVGIPEIMATLGFSDAGKVDERRTLHLKRLPELFDAAGFGFEPDKRFGPAPSLSEDLKLCVFPAERGGPVNANRPEYLAARTMAEIAALAARADELVVDAEIESITSDLVSFPEISDLDRSRLRAHAMALLANPSKLKAATKRLCELPALQRQAALASAVRAVLADQRITPSEVRFLEGLYKALGLPQDEVYSRLHSGEAAPKPASKSALPSAPGLGRNATGTEIDHEKLARLKEETSAVSSMLASIFKDDDATSKPADEKPVVEVEFAGLDAAHSSLLVRLAEAPMESDAFEAICRHHKLLPSGAIETINDWAFDALDDYAIEEGELICIQEHLIEPIKAMRKAI